MSEKICGIYKITNLVNGKAYIGESIDVIRRIRQHKKVGRHPEKYRDGVRSLYTDMLLYGLNNFSFEIIEQCSEDELYDKEKYWIKQCDTLFENGKGYNLTCGGNDDGGYWCRRKIYQYDLQGNYINCYDSIVEATLAIGANKQNGLVQNAVGRVNSQAGGYQWRYEHKDKIEPYQIISRAYKIGCYDKNGELVYVFLNASEAAKHFNCDEDAIRLNCKHQTCFTCDHMFEYFNDEPLSKIPVRHIKGRKIFKVKQILNGEVIRIFNSTKEAGLYMNNGVHNKNIDDAIRDSCKEGKKYKKFNWEYIKGGEED